MALHDGPVCFGEDGYFHPVDPVEDGNDVVHHDVKLKSVNGEFHTFDQGDKLAQPHNEFYNGHPVVIIEAFEEPA